LISFRKETILSGHYEVELHSGLQPMPNERRRRTERLFLRYPIRVEGFDCQGRNFSETTHTVVVNRHGGRVLLKAELAAGQTIKITHIVSGREADFRVVGLAGSPGESGGEWGVECRDEGINFWGISFPPMDESVGSSSVLLECEQCHDVALTVFNMVEYDLLESTGSLQRNCSTCRTLTTWIFSHNPTRAPEPAPGEAASDPKAISVPLEIVPAPERRRTPRVSLRLPLRVRNAKDAADLTKSENVSKGGVAFTSGFLFEVDEVLQITCPYNPSGDNIEVAGRVVRRQEVAGTGRYLYGIEYQR
jgi:hypothetical protein